MESISSSEQQSGRISIGYWSTSKCNPIRDVFNSLKGMPQLKTTEAKLTGFNVFEIPVAEVARMICKYKDKQIDSDFFVVEAEGQPPPPNSV